MKFKFLFAALITLLITFAVQAQVTNIAVGAEARGNEGQDRPSAGVVVSGALSNGNGSIAVVGDVSYLRTFNTNGIDTNQLVGNVEGRYHFETTHLFALAGITTNHFTNRPDIDANATAGGGWSYKQRLYASGRYLFERDGLSGYGARVEYYQPISSSNWFVKVAGDVTRYNQHDTFLDTTFHRNAGGVSVQVGKFFEF